VVEAVTVQLPQRRCRACPLYWFFWVSEREREREVLQRRGRKTFSSLPLRVQRKKMMYNVVKTTPCSSFFFNE
jgi:hypothetical protein